jgi:hypothetical protein
MSPELQKKLVQQFPLLYEDINFEFGDGWYDLILDLSKKIYPLIQECHQTKNEYDVYPTAIQVKEKYGTLHFYMNVTTDAIADLISEAEEASDEICELCGEPGCVDYNVYWLEARCPKCRN